MNYTQLTNNIIKPNGDVTLRSFVINNQKELTRVLGSKPIINCETNHGVELIGSNNRGRYAGDGLASTYWDTFKDDLIDTIDLDEDTYKLFIAIKERKHPLQAWRFH